MDNLRRAQPYLLTGRWLNSLYNGAALLAIVYRARIPERFKALFAANLMLKLHTDVFHVKLLDTTADYLVSMRRIKFLFLLLLTGLVPNQASTADGTYYVYGVKTDFTMSDKDIALHDVYLNLGTSQGVKEGTVLDVYRTITTVDEVNKRVSDKISFKIAKVRVIHSESSVSVARVMEMHSPKETPLGEIPAIVVGDSVEVARK